MKRTVFVIIACLLCVVSQAQLRTEFNQYNTKSITAIVCYRKNLEGFYYKVENVRVTKLESTKIWNYYAYDKKNQKLYVEAEDGNYVVELNDNYAKIYKKASLIPQLKEKEIPSVVASTTTAVGKRFAQKNKQIQEEKDRIAAQQREDSIRKAQQDSIRRVEEERAQERARQERLDRMRNYARTHRWSHVPVKQCQIYCEYCEKMIDTRDTIVCLGATNDSIAWLDLKVGALDTYYYHNHKGKISSSLKKNAAYNFHYDVFRDSLNANYRDNVESGDLLVYNADQFLNFMKEVQKKAPNGFFEEWDWGNEYSLTFDFSYRNTNKKTLKYIEVFWKALNPVNDVRNTGSFKGTGPVEQWDYGRWEWDHSRYYLAGDVSQLSITKVIITYMDNSKVVIPTNKLRFN